MNSLPQTKWNSGVLSMVKKTDVTMSIISGILLVLSFPHFDFYPLAWIALAILLFSPRGKTLGESFVQGMICGFVYFMGTVYWVSHSMYVYGNVPAVMTFFALILLCLYLSLYVGVFSMLFNYVSGRSRLPALLTAPVLWVSLEFFRTYALTGFPWSLIGYSQYKFSTLIQIADITGIYGVSFIVVSFNGMMSDLILFISGKMRRITLAPVSLTSVILSVLLMAAIISGVVIYGTLKLNMNEKDRKIKISVIQGNIPQDKKWDTRFQREVINTYERLTLEVSSQKRDIIVWPESAVPFVFGYNEELTEEVVQFQKGLDTYLLFGSVIKKDNKQEKFKLANSSVLLSPKGNVVSVYDKIHLVPYGEYVPLKKLFPFIGKMVTAIGDFVSGKETVVMRADQAKFGNLICYEIIFPGLVRRFVDKGANLLINITNDAWFGRTSAPYQHFSMAVFRAVENRVAVARSANTGISGFIDSKGNIINKSDIFVEAALTEEVSLGEEKSFYTRYGDVFAYACLLSFALLIIFTFLHKKGNYKT